MVDILWCLLRGALIGFSVAAPIGPIGLLCIRNTLSTGIAAGLACGLGAAVADAIYGILAAVGVGVVINTYSPAASILRVGSAVYLLWLASNMLRSSDLSLKDNGKYRPSGFMSLFGSTFVLTLSNPMTIASFSAILCSEEVSVVARAGAPFIVLGIFIGSCLWWFVLAKITKTVSGAMSPRTMEYLGYTSSAVIVLFAVRCLFAW